MAGKRVLVRGSINVDEFFVVPHIVESGETLASTSYSRRAGGKGANQAVSVSKAGAAVDFAGFVGSDGGWLFETLQSYGVGTSLLERDDKLPTGRAMIQLSTSTADNSIILLQGANFTPRDPSIDLSNYSVAVFQNEIPYGKTIALVREARQAGLVTVVNPSPMPPTSEEIAKFPWSDVSWLVVNEGEARALVAELSKGKDVRGTDAVLEALTELQGTAYQVGAVVTLGANGACALFNGQRILSEAGPVDDKVRDTTGAGDCFTGYFVAALADLPQCAPRNASDVGTLIIRASYAAALCVQKEGAMESVPSVDIVTRRMQA